MGHGRTGTIPHHHHRLLPGRDGHSPRLRRDRRAFFQQSVTPLLTPTPPHSPSAPADIRTWHSNVEQHASEGVNKILIGNKCDWTDKKVSSPIITVISDDGLNSGTTTGHHYGTGTGISRRIGFTLSRNVRQNQHQRRGSLLRPRPVSPSTLSPLHSLSRRCEKLTTRNEK